MTTTPHPLRISDDILELSKVRAQDEHTDQATALRQMLYLGAEEYLLDLVSEARMSIGRAAEILKKNVADLHLAAKRHGIPIGATSEQAAKSRQYVKKVIR